jgi:GT2 family glycosyltransferase
MTPSLTIYILCHNRPADTRHALQSVLAQGDQDFSLIVSDNSSNDEVQHLVKNEFPNVSYIRRLPMLPALEHFNCCIEEVKSDYFCLFHDDDLMSENFVSVMKKNIHDYPMAIAFGCNAHIETLGQLTSHPSFRSFHTHEIINKPGDLAMRYFSRGQSGIAPFPGYVYDRRKVAAQRLPVDGGKYSDVTWLLNLVSLGQIVWINECLMTYRMHDSNDGSIESMRDRLRFLRYIKQNLNQIGENVLSDYRCSFIYKSIYKRNDKVHLKRHEIAASFLRNYSWTRYLMLNTYKVLLNRALIKTKTK